PPPHTTLSLHDALPIFMSMNGASFKEYAMSFDGAVSKNYKWSYTPAAVYPASATVRFYFRGWDDAGGNIFDGSSTAPYSFAAARSEEHTSELQSRGHLV